VHPRWTNQLGAPLLAFVLTVAPSVSPVHAVEDARKVSVVSFGLFGDQGVFRSEATRRSTGRSGPFRERPDQRAIQFGEKAEVQRLKAWPSPCKRAANGMNADNDILFLISYLARLPRRPCSQGGAAYANAHAV